MVLQKKLENISGQWQFLRLKLDLRCLLTSLPDGQYKQSHDIASTRFVKKTDNNRDKYDFRHLPLFQTLKPSTVSIFTLDNQTGRISLYIFRFMILHFNLTIWLDHISCINNTSNSHNPYFLKLDLTDCMESNRVPWMVTLGILLRQSLKAEPLTDSWTVGCHLVNDI